MRYVPAQDLKEGTLLAHPIYGPNYEVLLRAGITLSASHIQRVHNMGYAGAYIEDDFSAGVIVKDLLPAHIRLSTIHAAKKTWQIARDSMRYNRKRRIRSRQDKTIMPIIEALIAHPTRLVELIDLKPDDDYIYYHAAAVVILSLLIGIELGLSGTQLYELGLSALLHDVGNIFIPQTILEKPGRLTPEEFETMQSHTALGFEYLRDNFEISIEGCMGALHHHENYDGTGYPNGLKKDKISIYGRIIAITDVYDALTSKRPFREMLYPPAAMDYLNAQKGNMFDPHIVETFQRIVPLYPTGLCVELDSGVRGIVMQNYVGYPDRPKVRLLNTRAEALFVDLHKDEEYRDTYVVRIVEL